MKFVLNEVILIVMFSLLQNVVYSNGESMYIHPNGINQGHHVNSHVFQPVRDNKNNEVYQRFQRSPAHGLADVARFVDKSPTDYNYTVLADDTMKRLLFRVVTFNATPIINVTKPSGDLLSNSSATIETGKNGTTIVLLDIPLTAPSDYGNWNFTRLDANTWDVTVQAESPVIIKHQFFEVGTTTPLKDNLLIAISALGSVQLVETGRLFSKDRIILQKILSFTDTKQNKFAISNTSILSETFYVGIQGKDNSNNTFIRIDPTEINPVLFRIDVSPSSGAWLFENTTMNVTFTIITYISTLMKVSISDTMGLVLQHKPVYSPQLKPEEHFTGTFIVQAGVVDVSTTVTIVIKYHWGSKWLDGPVVRKTFTVVTNGTTFQSSRNSENTDSSQTGTTSAIAGGISGALLILIGVVISVIMYKKLKSKRNLVLHEDNTDMPRNTKYTAEE